MPEVILHLSDTTYEHLVQVSTAVHRPLEEWIVDVLISALGHISSTADSHNILAAALEAMGFERLAPDKAKRLSTLLRSRKACPLSSEESAELQTLLDDAHALELASLQRLATTLRR